MDRHKPMKHRQKEDILSLFSSVYKGMGSVESTAKAARGWQKDTHIQEKPKEGQNGLLSKASKAFSYFCFFLTQMLLVELVSVTSKLGQTRWHYFGFVERYIKVHTATRWTIRHSLMLHWFADLMKCNRKSYNSEVTIVERFYCKNVCSPR